jgi:hypothetical protein
VPTAALTELIDEMVTILDTALGDDVEQVVGRRVFAPTPPAVDIYPADPFRTTDAAGFGDISGAYVFTVRARVNTTDNEAGQDVLLAMMDDEHDLCVAVALEDDQSLNGLASSVDVGGPSGYRLYVEGDQAFLGCEWNVTVVRTLS